MCISLEYGLFMAESEGYLDTHESKVQNMLKDLCGKHDRGITYMNLNQGYVEQFGLDIEDLTQSDVNRCERALLSGRRQKPHLKTLKIFDIMYIESEKRNF